MNAATGTKMARVKDELTQLLGSLECVEQDLVFLQDSGSEPIAQFEKDCKSFIRAIRKSQTEVQS